ncbi:MAG: leucyl/phenylalanyl-tRNA--protein transferase [Chloroflexi bacterium]|nr:MAG: leucyl/phenylalanyl-tRNA--protein transferase [Chloroflexota bacterium]
MELTSELLLSAYCQGVFPMAHEDGDIYWYDPDPRTILPLDEFHTPRSLKRKIKKNLFEIRVNSSFTDVMIACSAPAPGRESTWINNELIIAYTKLNQLGYAHSVEVWQANELVGGLYGVAVRGLFAGESMFSHVTDSSKIALVYLVERLRRKGYVLLDTQFTTDHLRQFGALEIEAEEYKRRLQTALKIPAQFV